VRRIKLPFILFWQGLLEGYGADLDRKAHPDLFRKGINLVSYDCPGLGRKIRRFLDCVMYFNDESGSGSYRSKGWNYEDEAWKSAEADESNTLFEHVSQ